jgi:hypothetical protein
MLGEQPENYSIEEKMSIVQAYRNGGLEGLKEIIDYSDEEEQLNGA